MNDIMKLIEFLEESGLLIKGVSEIIKNVAKEQKEGFLESITLGATVLGNLFTGKGAIVTSQWRGTIITGGGTVRSGQDFSWYLIL